MRRAVVLVLLFAGIAGADEIISLNLAGAGTVGPYALGYSHILVGSEWISINEQILNSPSDYRFDYDEGLIIFTRPVPLTESIKISFSILPLSLKSSYAIRQPISVSNQDTVIPPPALSRAKTYEGLEIIGSKRFIVNIGNRGEPGLSQSLDLNVSGKLAEDVSIRGSVSDRNFGSQAGGGTSSIDELDKILLHLEAPRFKADFGDLELTGIENSLLTFKRKLTGLDVSANVKRLSGSTSFAFSPGKQLELSFFGVDGKQGPYFLRLPATASSSGSNISRFLPGTEEVYLDSRKLIRGGEYDYNINYDNGYLEFTPRNVIGVASRITVKIQYASEGYRRTFYYGKIMNEGRFKLGAQFLGETDDKTSPRSFELGNNQKQALEAAGANADSAYLAGAKFVGTGKGDYNIQIDSLSDTIYVYAESLAGDYQVSFSRVGAGNGSYQYAGAGKYIYVGKGNGLYLPLIFYPLPRSQNYGSVMFAALGAIHFEGELAVSRNDRNTFSNIDDVLTGAGFRGSGGWRIDSANFVNKEWSIDMAEFRWRSLDKKFLYPGLVNATDYYRQYNLEQNTVVSNERLFEAESKAVSSQGDQINIGYGNLRGIGTESKRYFGGFNLLTFERLMLHSNAELSQSKNQSTGQNADWNKYSVGGKITKGVFQPGAAYRHEYKTNLLSTNFNYKADEYEAGFGTYWQEVFTSSTTLIFRKQQYFDSLAGQWHSQYHQYKINQSLSYGKTQTGFSGDLNVSRLYQKYVYPQNNDYSLNIGSLKINYNRSGFGLTLYESVNGTARVIQAREYIYVGQGKGDYRRDGDDYIPEQGGEYIQVIRQPDETESVDPSGYQISGGFRIRAEGRELTPKSILAKFAYESDIAFQNNLSSGVGIRPKHLTPIGNIKQRDFSYRNYDFRQSTTYRIGNSGDYIRHTLAASQSQGSQYQFENLGNKTHANAFEFRFLSGQKLNYLTNFEYTKDDRSINSGNVDLRKWRIGLVPAYQHSPALRFELPSQYGNEREQLKDVKVNIYSIGIKTVANFKKSGRVEGLVDYSRVEVNREDIFLPYVMASGKKTGDNYTALLTGHLRLNEYSSFELSYNYKKLGDGYANYNMRLEAKAEF